MKNPSATTPVNPWVIALTVMLATFMEILDTSVANVSLPHIAGNLSAGVDESTWVLTAYLVANAIVLPLSGWFSTLFGRKRFYMTCVALFTASSLLCGMAPTLGMLIFFRVMQGLSGGALQPVSQAILVESFPAEKRGMGMAVYGMGVVFAPIIGPTLGGWITDNYSWRWIFLINIPIGVLSVLLTSALIFDPPYLVRKSFKDGLRIDYVGLGLLSLGLASLEIVLDEGQRKDWFGSDFIVASAVIAALCLSLVVWWELRQNEPMVDLRLLKDRNFAISTLTMFMLGFVLYGSTTLLPILLQTLLGYTAMLSGLVLSPGGVVIVIMMPIVGFLLSRIEGRWLVLTGIAIISLSLFHMAKFNLDLDFATAVWARMAQSLGLAFLFVPINTVAFGFVPRDKTNNATGLINLARNIGGSSGIAFITTLLARRSQFHQQHLVSHLTPLDPSYNSMLGQTATALQAQGASVTQATAQAQGVLYGLVQRHSSMLAFADTFWLLGLAFLVMVPLLFLVRKTRPQRGAMPTH